MVKKLLTLLGALMALVGLSGCLEMESTISVNKDGSGQLSERVVMSAQMMAMMNMGATEDGADPLAQYSEESLKKKAASYGEGVEFVEVKKEEKDGSMIVTSVYKFADISNLKFNPGSMLSKEEELAEKELQMFSFEDGVLSIALPDPSKEGLGFGEDEMSEEEMAMAAPMFAGLKVSVTVVFPEGIEATNATYRKDDTVTLMAVDFDKLMGNEGGFAAMNKLKADSREDFEKAVKELDGVDMESQEKVTVTLK